jgi:predicted amidophosphoribosyltransferase
MPSEPRAVRRSWRIGWCAAAAPSQGRLGPAARARNVRGAFAVRRGCNVKGKRIVLVDDVLTTGATVEECARVLRRGGAAFIGVLTLSRAVRAGG